ncbi:hypothetical protein PIB30_056523 [Stylosanthes scabra]|uniref:Uncharacterized protein n=1 Tax=Stylosanthes scabra TaxID=79078 RepID=A0ABU6QJ09_9FABA|nr:hypothetical protein [Stylosanthes scabra]
MTGEEGMAATMKISVKGGEGGIVGSKGIVGTKVIVGSKWKAFTRNISGNGKKKNKWWRLQKEKKKGSSERKRKRGWYKGYMIIFCILFSNNKGILVLLFF